MFSLINYLLCLSIYLSIYSINIIQVCAQKEIDPRIKYEHAIRDHSIFQSIECNGKFDYELFDRIDQICKDCSNLFQKPGLLSQCRNDCFKNEFFDGCMEMILLNDREDIKNTKKDRMKLGVNLPFIQRPIVLPEQPKQPEAPMKSIWRRIYEAPWLP